MKQAPLSPELSSDPGLAWRMNVLWFSPLLGQMRTLKALFASNVSGIQWLRWSLWKTLILIVHCEHFGIHLLSGIWSLRFIGQLIWPAQIHQLKLQNLPLWITGKKLSTKKKSIKLRCAAVEWHWVARMRWRGLWYRNPSWRWTQNMRGLCPNQWTQHRLAWRLERPWSIRVSHLIWISVGWLREQIHHDYELLKVLKSLFGHEQEVLVIK